ncbi:MAG TPA: SBBP repeat-containing protein [Chloroflexota bacterium]|nr:SBBP repeat-containing protein [Chloroflexota bacterium]
MLKPNPFFHATPYANRRARFLLIILFLSLTAWLGALTFGKVNPATAHAAVDAAWLYSTYVGGDGSDKGKGIAVDNAGNMYIIGETGSDNFLGSGLSISGFSDIFVAKFNPAGTSLLYLTLIGSTDTDTPLSIQVDGQGNVYATALVFADDFPTQNALWSSRPHHSHNAALFKLNSSGDLVYSTYLPLNVFDSRHNLAVDGAGNAFVTGSSFQDDMSNQIGLLKISPNGSQLLLEKYVGGVDSEKGTAVTLDPGGNIYLTGTTEGGDAFPVTANAHQPVCGDIFYNRRDFCFQDGVVVVLNPAGQVTYSSHHGGSFSDEPQAIATDGQGNILIAGNTASGKFPLVQALQPTCPLDPSTGDCNSLRGFVSLIHLDNSAATLTYSTYLGSTEANSTNVVMGAAMDSSGQATVIGYTNGRSFPTANPVQSQLAESFCTTFGSQRLCFDAFIATFSPTGSLSFGTYLGGGFDEFPYGLALKSGNIFVTGLTKANDFPVTNNAFQPVNQIGDDAFMVKVGSGSTPPPPPPPSGDYLVYLPIIIR